MRDSLSLLDQAIAHAAGPVRAEDVRQMLGLADRTRIIDLFEALMRGDVAAALNELREQYDTGADPAVVLDRSRRIHAFRDPREGACRRSPTIRRWPKPSARAGAPSPQQLSMRVLSRTWQMLLKGITEVQAAGRRSPPPRWCWCASPMPPICRRPTR